MGGVAERPTRCEGTGPVRAASTAAEALQSRRTARRVSSCPAGEADRGGGGAARKTLRESRKAEACLASPSQLAMDWRASL